jgi:hypothetical protein
MVFTMPKLYSRVVAVLVAFILLGSVAELA